ncbi:MAG: hypothetical protein LBD56_00215 [Endomicrobium sp.]|nr:hypothetical protein [Endomicrobium sp.]
MKYFFWIHFNRKSIIYVCEEKTFNEHKNNQGDKGDKSKRLHFDIEHMEIYVWKDGDKDSIENFKV